MTQNLKPTYKPDMYDPISSEIQPQVSIDVI